MPCCYCNKPDIPTIPTNFDDNIIRICQIHNYFTEILNIEEIFRTTLKNGGFTAVQKVTHQSFEEPFL